MKILRAGDNFKKIPERNLEDVKVINKLISQGWEYCSKSVYKEFKGKVTEKETKSNNSENTKKITKEKRDEKKRKKSTKS